MSNADRRCQVCRSVSLRHFMDVGHQRYHRCECCEATLLDPAGYLTREQEQEVYALHDNQVDDPGYRRFLSRLTSPLLEQLPRGAEGLDFGCGPGPALASLLREAGMEVALYDPFFFPDASALRKDWDFVTCTEVAEHLHDAYAVFEQLVQMLRPGGWLGVMTCFQTDDARFAGWHYRRDPTHVVFYREATLAWLACHFGLRLKIPGKDVALMHKPLS